MKVKMIVVLLLLTALLIAQEAEVVATVNGHQITTTDLAVEFNFMNVQQANQLLQTPGGKEEVLETAIRRKLLLNEAREEKLDTLPSTKLLIQRQIEDALLQVKLNQIGQTAQMPSEDQIRQLYEANDTIFFAPKSIHVFRIVTEDYETAEIAHASLKGGIAFKNLMQRYPGLQMVPSGNIGWLAEDDLVPALKDALTRIGVGQFTEPMEIGGAWQIFYVEAKRDAGKLEYDEVREQIAQSLHQQNIDNAIVEYQNRMLQGASIQINEEVLRNFGQAPAMQDGF